METLPKRLALIFGLGVGRTITLIRISFLYLNLSFVPSKIENFRPSKFEARTERPFFYSIGGALKYSDQITSDARTLAPAPTLFHLVSPDRLKIAFVSDNKLLIVAGDGSYVHQVATVDDIFREQKPIGKTFFRNFEFQWTRDSRSLYLVKDEYYDSKGAQLYSAKAELWRFDLDGDKLNLVLKPFPAGDYFLGQRSGIYFSAATGDGNLILRYFDGSTVRDVKAASSWSIPLDQLNEAFEETPFFSFTGLEALGETFNYLPDKSAQLIIGSKTYLSFTQGNGIKGHFYCPSLSDSLFLPEHRYFLLDTDYCGNYQGRLLIDTDTGKYQTLPKGTRVYLTRNTDEISHYRITSGGILPH